MDWNDLRYVLALSREGSVRASALTLGVSHSTVARRIEAFEASLGVRLFDRTPAGYAATAAGEEMIAVALRVEDETDALERSILGQDARLARGHLSHRHGLPGRRSAHAGRRRVHRQLSRHRYGNHP